MSHEVLLAGEALLAKGALVGPFPSMQPAMSGQVLLAYEGFPALATGVRSLPSVDHLVPQEVGMVVEAPPTLATDVGARLPTCGMRPLMEPQVDFQPETLLALNTGVRTLAGMPQAVFAEARLVRETPSAFRTGIDFGPYLEV